MGLRGGLLCLCRRARAVSRFTRSHGGAHCLGLVARLVPVVGDLTEPVRRDFLQDVGDAFMKIRILAREKFVGEHLASTPQALGLSVAEEARMISEGPQAATASDRG